MQSFGTRDLHERDLATVGASLRLCEQGVDVLRVHNVPLHAAAYRGWAHLASPA
jgi:dihydropteroate synthase